MLRKDVKKLDYSHVDGNGSSTATWEIIRQILSKLKMNLHVTQHYTLGHLFQRNEDLFVHKNLYMDIHSSFIYKSSKLETIHLSFNGWMVKQTVWYIHTVKYNSTIKIKLILIQFGWTSRKLDTEWKKPVSTHTSLFYLFIKMENRLVIDRD